VVKIGEGTYGEAFKSGQVVLKFVPMDGSNLINGWPQKGAGDLLGEAVIALALTDLGREVDESGEGYTYASEQDDGVCVCWRLCVLALVCVSADAPHSVLVLGLGMCGAQLSSGSGEVGVNRGEVVFALALTDLGREVDESGEGLRLDRMRAFVCFWCWDCILYS
jgi:hypothetical protein